MNEIIRKQYFLCKKSPVSFIAAITLCIIFQFYFWKSILYYTVTELKQDVSYHDWNQDNKIEETNLLEEDAFAVEDQIVTEPEISIEDIMQKINETNNKQIIYNHEETTAFGNDSTIIIIQVHKRLQYLINLIQSLTKVSGIENALIIFSHDYYNDNINNVIKNITSFKYMQIFFPYSIQLYPTSFPGTDPRDCPRDLNPDFAKEVRCINAGFPDLYGHYREANYTQTKHHWWWKANTVFRSLEISKYFTGYVIFLEEDNYVTPDLLYSLNQTQAQLDDQRNINFICLGYHRFKFKHFDPNYFITDWSKSYCNIGMAFTRKYWDKVLEQAKQFCYFDDYNWDFSLKRLDYEYIHSNALILCQPRVFHTGVIGMHSKGKGQSCGDELLKIRKFIFKNLRQLFPPTIKEISNKFIPLPIPERNGGWADLRDHKLCMYMTSGDHLIIKHFKMIKLKPKLKKFSKNVHI